MQESNTLEAIRNDRLRKIAVLEKHGMLAYPAHSNRDHTIGEILEQFDRIAEQGTTVVAAGRILSVREHGASIFFDLKDGTGVVQAYLKKDEVEGGLFSLFTDVVDRSDIIEVRGKVVLTKRGERTVLVDSWRMLAKSLVPVPDQWYGLKDEDERYRKRYLDIILNDERAALIRKRSVFWNTARRFLLERDFVEVETPVLETTTGGAEARPFVTHHHALDIDVYLRISAGELWQKKLMVAGIPKTFEIGRIFRNEGMSHEHLQDYTQLEFYEAYADYRYGMEMVQELYRTLAQETFGTMQFTIGRHAVDLAHEWATYDYCNIITERYGLDPLTANEGQVRAAIERAGIHYDASQPMYLERGIDVLWKACRKELGGPGFLVNVPATLEPLAKRSASDSRIVERFQIILGGSEVGKGYSELNDPVDQRGRFERQEAMRAGGDDEAHMSDESFVEALEYGMPPAFGFGVSERLFSFFANISTREGQIFPLMRPRDEHT